MNRFLLFVNNLRKFSSIRISRVKRYYKSFTQYQQSSILHLGIVTSSKFKTIIRNVILILPIIVISFITFYSPIIMFCIVLFSSSFMLLFSYSWLFKNYIEYNFFVHKILLFMYNFGLLSFLGKLHGLIFYSPYKKFIKICLTLHIISFFYFLLTRYCFVHLITTQTLIDSQNYFFLFCLFIGIMTFYIRFLINLSIFVVTFTHHFLPEVIPHIFKIEGEGFIIPPTPTPSNSPPPSMPNSPPLLPPPPTSPNSTIKSFFHFSTHNHQNHHYQPKINFWRNTTLGLGIGTFALGSFTCYYNYVSAQAAMQQAEHARIQTEHARMQTEHARTQAEHAQMQTKEFERQNDLEEKSQGLMSEEQYKTKWKL